MLKLLTIFGLIKANEIELTEGLDVRWTHSDETIRFVVTSSFGGTIGFGLNTHSGMVDAEIVLLSLTDSTNCEGDSVCEGMLREFQGRPDDSPYFVRNTIWTLVASRMLTDSAVEFTIERPIDPEACDYLTISASTIKILFGMFEGDMDPDAESVPTFPAGSVESKTTHLIDYSQVHQAQHVSDCSGEECFTKTYRISQTLTPTRTQYWCKFVRLGNEDERDERKLHVVGFKLDSSAESRPYLHHALLYQCDSFPAYAHAIDDEFACGDYTMAYLGSCFHAVAIAAVGSSTFHFPQKAGYPINQNDGERFALLEVHYDNPLGHSGVELNSGLELTYTSQLRQFDAGHISVGATWMFYLPPQQQHFKLYGSCNKECLAAATRSNNYRINIFAASSHGHAYAQSIRLSKVRGLQEVERIVDEPHYDRLYQEYKYLQSEVTIGPNDDLMVTCDYRTQDTWVRGGLEQTNEMCYVFALYYPRIEDISFCSSMTPLEEVFSYFNMSNAEANYHRMGHVDEVRVNTAQGQVTGEQYFNANHPAGDYAAYENFLKQSDKIPMCTASKGNVFSLANGDDSAEPEPEPEPEFNPVQDVDNPNPNPNTSVNRDPYYGSHMTDVILPPILFNEQNAIDQCSRSFSNSRSSFHNQIYLLYYSMINALYNLI